MRLVIGWILGAAMGTGVMAYHEKRSVEAVAAHCADRMHKVESYSLAGMKDLEQDCIAKINQLGTYARRLLEAK